MNEEKNKNGRPTDYTSELADEICDVVSGTTKGLEKLCKENPHWPDPSTIYRWRRKNDNFYQNYARAKEFQAEVGADEIVAIADDGALDYTINNKGVVVVDHEHIQRSKLRVEARKWSASKLLSKRYGDKIQAEITGTNGAPIQYERISDLERKEIDQKLCEFITITK